MNLHTCRTCREAYPADEKDLWRTRNQCQECYNRISRERDKERRETRLAVRKIADPMIAPARVRLAHAWSSCDYCDHCAECRENVQNGRQVLCAPVYQSDLMLEKAYAARKEI